LTNKCLIFGQPILGRCSF